MIAIGDELNDLPMIEYAGLGIAMGNANDLVKQKARFVTLSNDEDGVAVFLETATIRCVIRKNFEGEPDYVIWK